MHIGAFGKIVHDLGAGHWIQGEARLGIASIDDSTTTEENFELEASGDYYFTPRHSVGALLGTSIGDATSEEGATLAIRGSAWVTPHAALTAQYETFMASDNAGTDNDRFSLLVNVRF